MNDLTVAENIFIGRESVKGLLLNKKGAECKSAGAADSLHINIAPTTLVRKLTVAKQQMVEIAKALL